MLALIVSPKQSNKCHEQQKCSNLGPLEAPTDPIWATKEPKRVEIHASRGSPGPGPWTAKNTVWGETVRNPGNHGLRLWQPSFPGFLGFFLLDLFFQRFSAFRLNCVFLSASWPKFPTIWLTLSVVLSLSLSASAPDAVYHIHIQLRMFCTETQYIFGNQRITLSGSDNFNTVRRVGSGQWSRIWMPG